MRDALLRRLLECDRRLVMVCAPAGAGKSTTLAQWLQASARPGAWLRIDERDDDVIILLRSVCGALASVASIDPRMPQWLALPEPPGHEVILPSLGDSIRLAEPFLFVIDDIHLLTSPFCLGLIGLIFDNMPEGGQLALGSRTAELLPINRWRASGDVMELGATDLALERSEAEGLLAAAGVELTVDELEQLMRVTEGWVTGVTLACHMSAGKPASEWLPNVRGDRREIADYLTDEVLSMQPDEVQEFLLETSILDPLTVSSCRAVTQRDDAQDLLAGLVRRNLFVFALDDRDASFRYGRLFAELLRRRLAERQPDRVRIIHRRAADWYGEERMWDATVRHLVAGGDVQEAAGLLAERWADLAAHGETATVRLLLDLFDSSTIQSHAGLTLAAAWAHLADGDETLSVLWGQRAAELRLDDVVDHAPSWWYSCQVVIKAALGVDGVHVLRDTAERAAAQGDADDLPWRQRALFFLGVAQWLCGDAEAQDTLSRLTHDTDSPNPGVVTAALAAASLVAQDRGDWIGGGELLDAAMEKARQLGIVGHRQNGLMLVAQARRLGRARDAEALVTAAQVRALSATLPRASWMTLLGAVTVGEVLLDLSRVDEAVLLRDEAKEILARLPDAGILVKRTHELDSAVKARLGAASLSAAEERVLQLLPTHLSNTEIAARLGVATPTVKSQLASLYRKLGARTRSEAVRQALRMRLLPET